MKHPAYIDGWFAHKGGQPNDNPYNVITQSVSYIKWESGWYARSAARRHGLDMSLDELNVYDSD